MPELPLQYQFYNQPARLAGLFWKITLALLLVAGTGLLIAFSSWGYADQGVSALGFVGMAISGSLAIAMAICALAMLPQTRRARAAFTRFAQGDYLAGWEYPPEFWQQHLQASARKARNLSRGIIGFIAGIALCIALLAVWAKPTDAAAHSTPIFHTLFAILITLAVALPLNGLVHRGIARRQQRMAQHGWAFLAEQSAYYGGNFVLWGRAWQSLLAAQILPGTATAPAQLQLTVGPARAMRNVAGVIDTLNLLTRHASNTSNYRIVHTIPIPPEQLQAVADAMAMIITEDKPPAPPLVTSAMSLKSSTAKLNPSDATPAPNETDRSDAIALADDTALHLAPDAPPATASPRPHRARRWWIITGWLAAIGLGLFVLLVVVQIATGSDKVPNTILNLGTLGLLCLLFAALTFVIAIIQQMRRSDPT